MRITGAYAVRSLRSLTQIPPSAELRIRPGRCVQFFDRYIDSDKIQDGDIIVYMGHHSKQIARTYQDGFDLEVMSAKELREKIKKENIL